MVNGRCPGCDYINPRGDLASIDCILLGCSQMYYIGLYGTDFHIGVGSDVVCSTIIGNARASTRGMDNRTIPRFFVSNSC